MSNKESYERGTEQKETKLETKELEEAELKVEAALFLAARWLTLDELVRLTGIAPVALRECLATLQARYNSYSSAITILKSQIENTESWKMDVKQEFAWLTNRLASGESEFTKAEQATLAVIAYKQPIKQSVVIKIRGNKAYDHIKHFMQVGLIEAKKAGRTLNLTLSNNFYNYFNLQPPALPAQKKDNVGSS